MQFQRRLLPQQTCVFGWKHQVADQQEKKLTQKKCQSVEAREDDTDMQTSITLT